MKESCTPDMPVTEATSTSVPNVLSYAGLRGAGTEPRKALLSEKPDSDNLSLAKRRSPSKATATNVAVLAGCSRLTVNELDAVLVTTCCGAVTIKKRSGSEASCVMTTSDQPPKDCWPSAVWMSATA